jgi:hypothetical protein
VDATAAAAPGSDESFLSLHCLAAEGTRRLLEACRAAGVGRVVYTGLADVVAAGARDIVNADEDSAPYPDKVWWLLHFLGVLCSALGSLVLGVVPWSDGCLVFACRRRAWRFEPAEVCCWMCKVSLGKVFQTEIVSTIHLFEPQFLM